ncbi:hypothetical protein Q3H58_001151 [Pseudomonas psychrotolerans]|uniref:Uncharacterized protein n=1 Tax=Pseudomonas oryzihabitans TaxID=47885 RepID=A0AAJ2EXT9_9PSED|nr:hypothetical protein [Pseudomonas psychrotolerans]MDR6354480.1 hypothetical protein [Pseudomonas psychrotolerans]
MAALAFQAASKMGIGSGTTSIPFSEAASPKGAFGQALGGAAPLASIRTQRIDLERAKALNAEPFSGNRRYLGAGAPVVTQTPSGQRCAPAFLPKAPRRDNAHECSELGLQFRHSWGACRPQGRHPSRPSPQTLSPICSSSILAVRDGTARDQWMAVVECGHDDGQCRSDRPFSMTGPAERRCSGWARPLSLAQEVAGQTERSGAASG